MGFIRDNFGRITIESRSESFYILPSYGYERQYPQVPLSEIAVGHCFRHSLPGQFDDTEPWQVVGQLIAETLIKPATRQQAGEGDRVDPKRMVHPVAPSTDACHHFVQIPGDGCLNLAAAVAAAVNIILYDRVMKEGLVEFGLTEEKILG